MSVAQSHGMSATLLCNDRNPTTVQRRLRGLARRYNELVDRISEVEFLADSIQLELSELIGNDLQNMNSGGDSHRTQHRRDRSTNATNEARQVLQRTAEAGATKLSIKLRSDGHSDVEIDENRIVLLPPVLADLLAVLALDHRVTDDQFVGWKTLDEIGILMRKRSGKTFTSHAITQSIYRLRNRLYHQGSVNPFLVQTNPKLGARFALKRKVNGVVTTSVSQHTIRTLQEKRTDECHTSG
jgi:hypothetical protein